MSFSAFHLNGSRYFFLGGANAASSPFVVAAFYFCSAALEFP